MLVLDTSVLVDSLTGPRRMGPDVQEAVRRGEALVIPVLVLYEWLRGPRTAQEIEDEQKLLGIERTLVFDAEDAALSARLYRSVRRARGREIDLAIAACAINREAPLWTLNRADFADIPGLQLYQPR
ncbi:MAG TPA: type II toxin-antitoxin system VapC family toxin [Bryobacteraceae bacterium]